MKDTIDCAVTKKMALILNKVKWNSRTQKADPKGWVWFQ